MAHDVEVGDIFVVTLMYEDTLPVFYQVVKVTEKTVTLRQIKDKAVTPESNKSDTCVPLYGDFVENEEPIRKVVQPEGHLRFGRRNAYLWNGKPQYRSWYG